MSDTEERNSYLQRAMSENDREDCFHGTFRGVGSISSKFRRPATGDATASLVLLLHHVLSDSLSGVFRRLSGIGALSKNAKIADHCDKKR